MNETMVSRIWLINVIPHRTWYLIYRGNITSIIINCHWRKAVATGKKLKIDSSFSGVGTESGTSLLMSLPSSLTPPHPNHPPTRVTCCTCCYNRWSDDEMMKETLRKQQVYFLLKSKIVEANRENKVMVMVTLMTVLWGDDLIYPKWIDAHREDKIEISKFKNELNAQTSPFTSCAKLNRSGL